MQVEELRQLLLGLRASRDDELRHEFDRSLPFADGLFDRWERARSLGFGDGASIYDSAVVFGQVAVGEHSWIGPYTVLDGSGGQLSIGSFCSVSAGVQIYTHDTVMWALSGGSEPHRTAPVAVGDRCHLGAHSIVLAGVTIGTRCVIAANSVVTRSVPDDSIVGGSPARPLGRVVDVDGEIQLRYATPGGDTRGEPEPS